MSLKLKPVKEQVIVITGASSGIGLATAEQAAKKGAKLVLAARSDEALRELVDKLTSKGKEAIFVECDVTDEAQVKRVADEAIGRFGRIDTWVNNAGIAIYGRLDEVSNADSRQLFETNFWGLVYGSLAALPHLKKQGGALINLGSEVSEAYMPLLGMYTASKHAVKGFPMRCVSRSRSSTRHPCRSRSSSRRPSIRPSRSTRGTIWIRKPRCRLR